MARTVQTTVRLRRTIPIGQYDSAEVVIDETIEYDKGENVTKARAKLLKELKVLMGKEVSEICKAIDNGEYYPSKGK